MTDQTSLPADEYADRLEIRNLIDAWARSADRREPREQAALFSTDGRVAVYTADPATSEPVHTLTGQSELAEAFKVLETYDATSSRSLLCPGVRHVVKVGRWRSAGSSRSRAGA